MKKFGKWFKKVFIPHEANNHRPSALCAKTVVPVLIAIVIIQTFFFLGSSYLVPHSQLFGLIEAVALTDGTNAARASDHVPTLTTNLLLQAAAQEKANDMVANNYFAHTSPAGVTPWYWFTRTGYHFSYAGENLAVNFSESQDVTAAWLNSPGHRANILDAHFTEIGMAVARGSFEGRTATYVVELFGAPAANVVGSPAVGVAVAAVKPASPLGGKSVAIKPTPSVLVAPLVIVTSTRATTGSQQMFVAVKGAQTSAVITSTEATDTVKTQNVTAVTSVANNVPAPAVNPVVSDVGPATKLLERLIANPAHTMNYLYYLILFFFALALGLNIFVKIRVQHPDLILGGLVAISVAGIFIIVNQHYFLGAVIR